jgi:hypothetical protein
MESKETAVITFRVSPEELQSIETKAAKAGSRTAGTPAASLISSLYRAQRFITGSPVPGPIRSSTSTRRNRERASFRSQRMQPRPSTICREKSRPAASGARVYGPANGVDGSFCRQPKTPVQQFKAFKASGSTL